jgi:Primase C terminal 1 (PriCT-1)
VNHDGVVGEYKTVYSGEIIELPDSLLEFLIARWEATQKTSSISADQNETQPIPTGARNKGLASKAGLLRKAGLAYDDIREQLLKINQERCQPPLDETEVNTIARSISKYPVGKDNVVYSSAVPEPAAAVGVVNTEEETEIEDVEDVLPEFPHFSGLLSELCDVICPDLPYEFKFMAAVTHWGLMRSGLDTLENEPHLQPRFYTCLIAMPGTGKTGSINEIRKVLTILNPNYVFTTSVDSGPALVDEFVDFTRTMSLRLIGQDSKNATQDKSSRVLLDPDEMADLFEKSKMTAQSRNSLSQELLKLYESNRTGNRSRKAGKAQVDNAHLAILAGATPEGYERMWTGTGGGSTGLQSRIVPISTADGKMGVEKKATNFEALKFYVDELIALANRPGQVISLNIEAKRMLRDWWGSDRMKPSESRVDDMVKRLVIVLAATNDVLVVGPDLMAQAVKFGDYVIATREKYNPSDSHSWTQAFEQEIIRVGQKHKLAMTMRDYQRVVHPNRKPGGYGSFLQAWKTLIQAGVLKADGATHKGTMKYRVINQ